MDQLHYSILGARNNSTLRLPTKTKVENTWILRTWEKRCRFLE